MREQFIQHKEIMESPLVKLFAALKNFQDILEDNDFPDEVLNDLTETIDDLSDAISCLIE